MSYSILRPQTDKFIFENPSTQPCRPRKPKRPVHNPTRPSQELNDLDTTGLAKSSVETPASSSDRSDDQSSKSNIVGDDDDVGGGSASIEDLFDIAGDDERTTDGDSRTPLEDQASLFGQDGQAKDSDTNLKPAETRNKIPREHSANPGQARQNGFESKLDSSPFADVPIVLDVEPSAVNLNNDRDSPLDSNIADKANGLLNKHRTQPDTTGLHYLRAGSVDGKLLDIPCVTCIEPPIRSDDGNRCEGSRQPESVPCSFEFGVGIESTTTSEGAGEDVTQLLPPAKRPRLDTSLDRHADQPSPNPEAIPFADATDRPDQWTSQPFAPSTPEGAEIPIRGHLSLKFFRSKVVYCLNFSQELSTLDSRERSVPGRGCHTEDRRDQSHSSTPISTVGGKSKHAPYLPDEDALLVELKEERGLTWGEIAEEFPGRTRGALQVRYCNKLNRRPERTQHTRKRRRSR